MKISLSVFIAAFLFYPNYADAQQLFTTTNVQNAYKMKPGIRPGNPAKITGRIKPTTRSK